MIRVLYAQFTQQFTDEVRDRYAASITFDPLFRLDRYLRWEDAQAHLIGRLLLARGMASFGIMDIPPLAYSAWHRPSAGALIDFSIAHSGQYVLCALSDGARVGIDVERIRPVDLISMQPSFSRQQWEEIMTSDNPAQQLFDSWTRKEAVAKADGRGMHILDQISWHRSGAQVAHTVWHLQELKLSADYCIYLAASEKIPTELSLIKVTL